MAELPAGLGLWLSTPNVALLELARARGVAAVVLDVEHGTFDLAALDSFLAFGAALGLKLYAKVLAPERAPIQQALDFGAAGVIVPHIGDLAHARMVTGFAKFPPHGSRSFAGGRTVAYGAPADDFFVAQDRGTACLPMIESAEALEDVEAILALDTVDGVFVGPSDLSLRRMRGRYARSAADRADLERIAAAARRVNKPWVMPAWTRVEQGWARELGAQLLVIADEQSILADGLQAALDAAADQPARDR
jgi:4-hydroxy-2-oxoheptanedioate aldolase